ncbi:MAG: cytochrome c peroxidase [Planctomycetota bacterium]
MRLATLALAAASPLLGQARLDPPPVPVENPMTPAKVALGKALFWDEQISSSKTVACATCHVPEAGGSDPRPAALHPGFDGLAATDDDVHGSFGVVFTSSEGPYAWEPFFGLQRQATHRKAPSILMAAYDSDLFWDGRAPQQLYDPATRQLVISQGGALERQAMEPFLNEVEMTQTGTEWPTVVDRVRGSRPLALAARVPAALAGFIGRRSYPELFTDAFGTTDVTPVRIAMAIASYERTLVPSETPMDRYLAGEQGALTPLEEEGFAVFQRSRCTLCHESPTFGGSRFFNIGVRPPSEDPGRASITRQARDVGAFKTPSLRNVAQRAPYFHNGGMATLADVVDFYDRGGDFAENRSHLVQPLGLNANEKAALLAFLDRPLTDARAVTGAPPFDHPALSASGPRSPRHYGRGTAGTGGRVPRLVAIEPPLLGNGEFHMALTDGAATAPASLLLDLAPGRSSLFGVQVLVGLTPALQVLPLGQLLHGSGGGDGWAAWNLALPDDPAFAGLEFFAQGLVLDAGGPQGLSASAAVRWRLFGPR